MKKGFTLIELLVVIAIIAILAAILFPVFAQAREKARESSCLSNCKQIATALQLYTDDYDENFPAMAGVDSYYGSIAGGFWNVSAASGMSLLNPYIKNDKLYICPSAAKHPKTGPGYDLPAQGLYRLNSYIFNGAVCDGAHGILALAQIKNPSSIIMTTEAQWADPYNCLMPFWHANNAHWWAVLPQCYGGGARLSNPHNNGANSAYADGHAKRTKKWQDLRTSDFGRYADDGSAPLLTATNGFADANVWNG